MTARGHSTGFWCPLTPFSRDTKASRGTKEAGWAGQVARLVLSHRGSVSGLDLPTNTAGPHGWKDGSPSLSLGETCSQPGVWLLPTLFCPLVVKLLPSYSVRRGQALRTKGVRETPSLPWKTVHSD